jgi:mannitol-1-phosphate 5-dehydrogenase
MSRTFVGFGFGPIQTGLMLCEAFDAAAFDRFVIAEVDQALVDAVRAAGNTITINIAGRKAITAKRMAGIELFNPRVPEDRAVIVSAITEASELATAIPSINLYAAGGDASIASMIAAGVTGGRQRIIYTAENNNFAAEALDAEVRKRAPAESLASLQILNTVVGKMSGVVSSAEEMRRLGLAPLVPGFDKCVLVEEFNRILISRVTLPGFKRGITVFQEKDDLLPFEEAKLYGHNATHALAGYLGALLGVVRVASLRGVPGLLPFLRAAFLEESGESLIRKHGGVDPLFTRLGYTRYADDLLERMTNPHLLDTVERVARDPARKLAWEDRLVGTMRLAMRQGVTPRRYALGAAASAAAMDRSLLDSDRPLSSLLVPLWAPSSPGLEEQDAVLALVEDGRKRLRRWRDEGYPELEGFLLKV